MKYIKVCLSIFTYCSFSSFIVTSGEWTLKKHDKEVFVYNREVEGSSVKELKSVTQINTSLSSIIALLQDRATYPEWVYKCGTSFLIKKISDEEGIYYQNVLAPWPVDNRDFVVDVKVSQDPATKVVIQQSNNAPDFLPVLPGTVRINEFTARWTLTPLKNGMVNCEYQLLVAPGGNIPVWLVNLAAVDGPFETTVNLRKWVIKDKYQHTSFQFIKELN